MSARTSQHQLCEAQEALRTTTIKADDLRARWLETQNGDDYASWQYWLSMRKFWQDEVVFWTERIKK